MRKSSICEINWDIDVEVSRVHGIDGIKDLIGERVGIVSTSTPIAHGFRTKQLLMWLISDDINGLDGDYVLYGTVTNADSYFPGEFDCCVSCSVDSRDFTKILRKSEELHVKLYDSVTKEVLLHNFQVTADFQVHCEVPDHSDFVKTVCIVGDESTSSIRFQKRD
jgi:translation initiation factor 2 alpha subunit (eIF-2alpha)